MAAKKKGAGGKLSRSEIVTVRLDPKLRFAAELVARKQRRTLSSFVEWAIEKAVSEEVVRPLTSDGSGDTALEAMARVWDVEEADRFIKFAENYPELLNYDEECLWKIIKETPYFFIDVVKNDETSSRLEWSVSSENINFRRVRDCWGQLQRVLSGEESKDLLPVLSDDEIRNNFIPF